MKGQSSGRRLIESRESANPRVVNVIMESALDAIVMMDRHGLIQGWSSQAEMTFGQSEAEVIGRSVADTIIPERFRQKHRDGLARYLAGGDGPVLGQILELSAMRKNGAEFPIEIAISRPYGQRPDITFVAFIRDITQRVAVQEELARRRAQEAEELRQKRSAEAGQARQHAHRMRELEHLKSEFMKLVSHELRGPLTIIRGYIALLADGSIQDPAPVLPTMAAKASQMNSLLNQMLEVARLEEGKVQLALRRVDMRQIISEALEEVVPRASDRHEVAFDAGAQSIDVMADPRRIRSIVANLVDNAIKYSPGGGHVRCLLSASDDAAFLEVHDTGVGIARSDMSRLFTRFGRIVTPDNSSIDGSGLGLFVSREIALLHGGDIEAVSSPRLGTTFRLSLPLAETLEWRPSQTSNVVRLPVGESGYDICNLPSKDMIRLGSALQRLVGEAADDRGAAAAVCQHLHAQLMDGNLGTRGTALVRFYKTDPFGLLGPDEAVFARAVLHDDHPRADMRCLRLLGSAGELTEWNDPAESKSHRVIPLPSEAAVAESPMVAQLLKQLGLDVGALVAPDAGLIIDSHPGTHGIFYVPNAVGSPYVPAQDEFVLPRGIESVVGFGGLLMTGEVMAIVIFSKVHVPRSTATMFRVLTPVVMRAMDGLGLRPPK